MLRKADKRNKTDKSDKTELFENIPVPKAVMRLSIPMVISSLIMVVYNLADTFFVGMINDPIQTSAVTLVAPVVLAFNAIVNLAGVGTASLISRALGVQDRETVRKTSAFGFYCAVIAGAIFSLGCTVFKAPLLNLLGTGQENFKATSDYLFWTVTCGAIPSIVSLVTGNIVRAEGMSGHASVGTISGCILNIILDPIFILPQGLNMGAAGAGCATFISNCVACIYFIVLFIVRKNKMIISINPAFFRPNLYIVKEVCGVGIPAAVQNLLNVTGMTVLNNFMSAYGTEAVSAIGIAHKIAMILMYFSMGFGQGIMPLVGYNYSSGNRARMKEAIVFAVKVVSGMMIAFTIAFCVFSGEIISLFMKDPLVVKYGAAFLIGQTIAEPFLALDFLGVGVFQACGMGKKSFIFACLRKIVLEIPALVVLNKIFPMYGLAYAALVAEVVLATASAYELIKMFSYDTK